MADHEVDSRGAPLQRPISPLPAGEVARRLIERARSQHQNGLPAFKTVRSGLPSLDAETRAWWGLTVLAGGARSGKTTLAARLALETARAGERVLWLDLGPGAETPVFRMLTGLSRVRARALFVERGLTGDQWGALESAATEIGALPLMLAEAHGATVEELGAAVAVAQQDGPLGLVILDGLGRPERPILAALERVADKLDVPLLAVVTLDTREAWRDERRLMRGPFPQRPGSLRLRLTRQEPDDRWSPPPRASPVWLDVYRAGQGFRRSIELQFDPDCRWLEEIANEPALSALRVDS